ncbi:MAG: transposase [Tannerella sp.]|jgi:REP element-mobilizing transposase RayT|nr:transposase [Tannerella sp.]
MKYNPNIHHRRSIRLKGYDYSLAGLYFITICVNAGEDKHVRPNLFGKISDGKMILNDAGRMVEKWCTEISHKFSDIIIDAYVIMPNHYHAIIINNGAPVGADLRVCPDDFSEHGSGNVLGEPDGGVLGGRDDGDVLGEHIGSPLRAVIQWFKTMTTNEYIRGVKTFGWQTFNKKLWQRNYWEHIIRNEQAYNHIANYILNNPMNWGNDHFYQEYH